MKGTAHRRFLRRAQITCSPTVACRSHRGPPVRGQPTSSQRPRSSRPHTYNLAPSMTSLLYLSGMPFPALQQQARHASPSTTALYVHGRYDFPLQRKWVEAAWTGDTSD